MLAFWVVLEILATVFTAHCSQGNTVVGLCSPSALPQRHQPFAGLITSYSTPSKNTTEKLTSVLKCLKNECCAVSVPISIPAPVTWPTRCEQVCVWLLWVRGRGVVGVGCSRVTCPLLSLPPSIALDLPEWRVPFLLWQASGHHVWGGVVTGIPAHGRVRLLGRVATDWRTGPHVVRWGCGRRADVLRGSALRFDAEVEWRGGGRWRGGGLRVTPHRHAAMAKSRKRWSIAF